MNYTLVVVEAPDVGRAPFRALSFARALKSSGHHLQRVFFYGPGVRIGLAWEGSPQQAWHDFATEMGSELLLCSASADRWQIKTPPEGFDIAGLGSLMEAGMDSDRVITFA